MPEKDSLDTLIAAGYITARHSPVNGRAYALPEPIYLLKNFATASVRVRTCNFS
jgi:hypothetical protein